MKILRRTSFLLIIIFGLSNHTWAQKQWSLEGCISLALQKNIQLKRSMLQVDIAKVELTQSAFEMGPNLSGYINHQYLNGTTFNQYSLLFERLENQGGSLGIGSSLTIFDGFYGLNNRSRLKYQLLSRKEDTEILKNSITLNVVVIFLQILMDSESHKLALEQAKLTNDQFAKAESQLSLGTISQGDYLSLKAQKINQQAQVTNASNRLTSSTIELAQLLEFEDPSGFAIEIAPITLPGDPSFIEPKVLFKEIEELRPEIKKAKFDIKSAEKGVHMAYGLLSPRLSISYTFGSGYDQSAWYKRTGDEYVFYPEYSYRQQIKDYNQHLLQFRLSVPIFQKMSTYTQISQSRIQLLDAKLAKEEVEKKLYKNILVAHNEAVGAMKNFLAYDESVRSFRELYDQMYNRFNLGMVNAQDLALSQNNLIKAEGDQLYAKYSYVLRVKILDFYRGVPITL